MNPKIESKKHIGRFDTFPSRKKTRRRRLRVERLEDRRLLAASEPAFVWAIEDTGRVESISSVNGDIIRTTNSGVERLSTDGVSLWKKSIDLGLVFSIPGASYAAPTLDNSTIIMGQFKGTRTFGSTTLTSEGVNRDCFIAKLSSSAEFIWAKQVYTDHTCIPHSMQVRDDGVITMIGSGIGTKLWAGATSIDLRGSLSQSSDNGFIAQLNPEGGFLNVKIYADEPYYPTHIQTNISKASGNRSIITGAYEGGRITIGGRTFTDTKQGRILPGKYNLFIARFEENLDFTLVVSGGNGQAHGEYYTKLSHSASNRQGASLFSGVFTCKLDAGPFVLTAGECGQNRQYTSGFAAKASPLGQFEWAMKLPIPPHAGSTASYSTHPVRSVILDDGSSLLGVTFEGDASLFGRNFVSKGGVDTLLIKLDANGNLVWLKHIGTAGDDHISDLDYSDGFAFIRAGIGGDVTLGKLSLSEGGHLIKVDPDPENNATPTLNAVSGFTTLEDAATQTVNLSGISAGDEESQPLRITASSNNVGLITDPSITYTSPDATGSLAVTAHPNKSGSATITVTVEDGGPDKDLATTYDNATFSRTFDVVVAPVNDAPTLDSINNLTIQEDASKQTIKLTGISAGPEESQPLKVTATSNNAALIPSPAVSYTSANSTGNLAFTPANNRSGTATFTVTVEDGGLDNNLTTTADNATFSRTFDVLVNPINDDPTLDAIDNVIIDEDAAEQTVALSGISAGADASQNLKVTATSENTGLLPDPVVNYTSANANGSLAFTPIADQSGTATITVTVEDAGLDNNMATTSDNATFSRTFDVIVNPVNDDPTLNSLDNLTINEDAAEQTVNLVGITAGPSESQILKVTATSDNTGLILDPTVSYTSANPTGTLAFTPLANQSGTATITVTVEDAGLDNDMATTGDNATFSRTLDVIVNATPTIDSISDKAIDEDAAERTINLSGITAGGAESQLLRVTASSSNTRLLPDPTVSYASPESTGSLTFKPSANQYGETTIEVTVEDAGADNDLATAEDNAIFSRAFEIIVQPVNDPPTLSQIYDLTINEDSGLHSIILNGIADTDGYVPSQTASQWAVSDGGNGHWYWRSSEQLQWAEAKLAAEELGGYLATLTDGRENDLAKTLVTGSTFLGGSQDLTSVDYSEPRGGWSWVTGEPWQFAPWASGNPDNSTFSNSAGENVLEMMGTGEIFVWNDANELAALPYLIEYASPLRVTATSSDTSLLPDPAITFTNHTPKGSLQLQPLPDAFGTVTITVLVEDGGFDGELATTEDNATFSRTFHVVVNSVNDTPILDPAASPAFEPILEDSVAPSGPVGTLVSALIDSGGTHNNYSDVDGDLPGIAITSINPMGGSLWYSEDNGTTWNKIQTVSDTAPRLLFADAASRLYLEPAQDFSGEISDVITFKAWDRNFLLRHQQLGTDIDGESENDFSGVSVSLSADGRTLAVGAYANDGNGSNSGHVRIYRWTDTSWQQLGAAINGEAVDDYSGISVSLSADGQTVAIGARGNDGNGPGAGHVRIYRWTDSSWQQLGGDIDGEAEGDGSGYLVSLSSDGHTVAIGAMYNDGNGTNSGHVRVYRWMDSSWKQLGTDIDGEAEHNYSGKVAISADGQTVAVGADANDGNGTNAGHVRIYRWTGSSWQQRGADIEGETSNDQSGSSVSLSSDGQTVAIGANHNDGNGHNNGNGYNSGHVRIYRWIDSSWQQLGKDIDGEAENDHSGVAVSLSADGQTVAIGSADNDDNGSGSGHVRVYRWTDSSWHKLGADLDGESEQDGSGDWGAVSLSSDGQTVAIGALFNDGNGSNSGHVRVYGLNSLVPVVSIAEDTVGIQVNPVNDNPTIDSLSNLSMKEDAPEQTVNLSGISAGADEKQELRVTATSNNTNLMSEPTVIYASAESTGSLSFTPAANQSGTVTITVTVEDGGLDGDLATPEDNASFARTFDVVVNPVNDLPTLDSLDNLTIDEDAAEQTVNLAGITSGPSETQTLKVIASSDNTGLILDPTVSYTSSNPTGTLAFTPLADQSGTATITVTVEDAGLDNDLATTGDNATFSRAFEVLVTPVNDDPTLDSLDNLTIDEDAAQQTVNLAGITAGADEAQALKVTATSDNTGLILDPTVSYSSANPTGTLTFTPLADQNGTATITVTVEDAGLDNDLATTGDNATFSRTFDVIVTSVNDDPTFDAISDLTIDEDAGQQTINIAGIGSGPSESQSLRVTASSDNPGLIPDPTVTYTSANPTGSLDFTSAANQHGTATITVTVEDAGLDNDLATTGDNENYIRTFVVVAKAINDPPTLNAFDDLEIDEDAPLQTVQLAGISSGPLESQTLRVTATSDNTDLIPDPTVAYTSGGSTGSLSFKTVADQSGTATITVTVEDAGLDNDFATAADNSQYSQGFVVAVGLSTFSVAPNVITLVLRGHEQTLSIFRQTDDISLNLKDGLWSGVQVDGVTGNNSPTLIMPASKLRDRVEIITTSDQSFHTPTSSLWVLGTWDPIQSPTFRPMVLESDRQSVFHVAGQKPWKNFASPHDINNDGKSSVLDALTIINELSRGSFVDLDTNQLTPPSELSEWPGIYYDTNGDDRGTVLDALLVINELARTGNSSGEGEFTDAAIQEWSRDLTPISIANQTSDPLTMNQSTPSPIPSLSPESDDYVSSPQVVDAEYESMGSESLKTLDESLLSLLAE